MQAPQQQQQQQVLHPKVASAIELSQRFHPQLVDINCLFREDVNRVSIEHLSSHLQGNDGQRVTELKLCFMHLSSPSDGGLEALCNLFANNTSLTKVVLCNCGFGGTAGGTQVLDSIRNNQSISDLTIEGRFRGMPGRALGACLSQLLHNNPTLQRLTFLCQDGWFCWDVVRPLLPGLQANQSLTALRFNFCGVDDECLRLIAENLAGNTTLRVLDIGYNSITTNGSVQHFTTLLQSTRLQAMDVRGCRCIDDAQNLQRVRDGLLRIDDAQNLQRLRDGLLPNPHLLKLVLGDYVRRNFPQQVASIRALLARNQATCLLLTTAVQQPGEPEEEEQPQVLGGIWHSAIAHWARRRPHVVGASAIFKVLRDRADLLLVDVLLRPLPQQQK